MIKNLLHRAVAEENMPQDVIIQTFERCAAGVDMHSADGSDSPEVRRMVEMLLTELQELQYEIQVTPYMEQCMRGMEELISEFADLKPVEAIEQILREWCKMSRWSVVFRYLLALREQMLTS